MHHLYCDVFGCHHLRLGASIWCADHQPPEPAENEDDK